MYPRIPLPTCTWPHLNPAIYCREKGEDIGKRCNESWEREQGQTEGHG